MQPLDRDIGNCRALVIDGNPTSRSILAAQLRDFGVGTIVQCSRINDARRQLEVRDFDIVLCDYHFQSGQYSGQELLDDLRRAQLLPFSTVFIMVTAEASYAKVAEAAEGALDGYLLKPHTATALGARLKQARHRKRVLKSIFESIESGAFEQAARLCLERFHQRGEYWLYAARIGAELLLRLERPSDAQKLYEAVIATQALPWARLGVARAQLDDAQGAPAQRTLEALIGEQPGYADAYDVMGRLQVEQGQFDEALATYRQASELTPSSIARLQKQGALAFYLGEREESAKALERAALLGISSKMFDFQSLVLLAVSRFHERDSKGLQRCLDNLSHALEKAPGSARLKRFVAIVRVFNLMLQRQLAAVVAEIKELAGELRDERFDMEAACNLLTLLAQLRSAELELEMSDGWIDALALRFAASKTLGELLARAAGGHAPYAERVRAAQQRIAELAEQAMSHSLAGDHQRAVQALLEHGRATLNGKLLDMARMALQRHHAQIADAAALSTQIEALRTRYALQQAMPALGGERGRQSGGLRLRGATAVADAQATATPAAAS
jgi:CheY-like chemotaxis protein